MTVVCLLDNQANAANDDICHSRKRWQRQAQVTSPVHLGFVMSRPA